MTEPRVVRGGGLDVAVEFAIPGLPETLFLVRDEAQAIRLKLRRSRCWTPADVEAVRGLTPGERLAVAEARILFDGLIRMPPQRTTFVGGAPGAPGEGKGPGGPRR